MIGRATTGCWYGAGCKPALPQPAVSGGARSKIRVWSRLQLCCSVSKNMTAALATESCGPDGAEPSHLSAHWHTRTRTRLPPLTHTPAHTPAPILRNLPGMIQDINMATTATGDIVESLGDPFQTTGHINQLTNGTACSVTCSSTAPVRQSPFFCTENPSSDGLDTWWFVAHGKLTSPSSGAGGGKDGHHE